MKYSGILVWVVAVVMSVAVHVEAKADNAAGKEFLPEWKCGYLDLHFIATGRGDCSFIVMPDGTTALVDAGDVGEAWRVEQPNGSMTPPEWIVKYIRDYSVNLPRRDTIDYFLLTHYHGDHAGTMHTVKDYHHGYALSGITKVGEDIHFNKIIDRDCPDYNYPSRQYITNEKFFEEYIKFVFYQRDSCGTKVEKFKVGSRNQFAMVHQPKRFKKDFEIYNIAANGYIHTGKGMKTRFMYDEDPNGFDENMNSCVFLMKYGKFSYYNGGDIGSGPHESFKTKHRDGETQIAKLINQHVTVIKPDHHGWKESTNGYFLKVLSPEVIVEMCSNREHPYSETLERMADPMSYESPRQFYITTEGSKERIERKDPALWQHFVPYHGHVVVRVYEGGRSYQVFVLDAKMPDYHVLYKSPVVNL